MTNCAECLEVLSTTGVADIPRDSDIAAHLESCPNCSRLATEIEVAERRLALSLDASIPVTPPTLVADTAITASELHHRRAVASWVRRGLAFGAGLLFVMFTRSDTGRYFLGTDDFERQSIQLNCLTRDAALELATPYLRSHSGRVYRAADSRTVTVQGRAAEVNEALSHIEEAERAAHCTVQVTPPPSSTP